MFVLIDAASLLVFCVIIEFSILSHLCQSTKKLSCYLTGTLSEAQSSKKHISSKVVVIILLLCVIVTTVAFLASVACYYHRRDKCPIQRPLFSSDRETSCNSATNLISHKTWSLPETKIIIDSPIKHITGKNHSMFHKYFEVNI